LSDTKLLEASRAIPVLDKLIQVSIFTFVAFSMFSISVTQIALAIGIIGWLLKIHFTKSWKDLRGTQVGIPILCFCLACILSIITSVDWKISLGLIKKLVQFVIIFWVANVVQDKKQRALLVGLIIVAGVVSALNGLSMFLNPDFSGEHIDFVGTMSSVATFSGTLMLVSVMTLGHALFQKPKKYWLFWSVGIIGLCLLSSLTRQAWLGFFLGTAFLVYFWNKKYLLVLPLLLAGLLLFSPDRIKNRMVTMTDLQTPSLQARIGLWKGGVEIFKDYPLTGCGYKCVDLVHSQYPDPIGYGEGASYIGYLEYYKGMHNNILQLLIDTGVIGLGFWISIWATYFIEILKRFRALANQTCQNNFQGILMGSLAAAIAFLIGGFFETNIYDSEVAMLLYFLMGISLTDIQKSAPKKNLKAEEF